MNKQPIRPTFEALIEQGRLIVTLNAIAVRYVTHVARTAAAMEPPFVHTLDACNHMRIGMVEFLKSVGRHYALDTDMLDSYDNDRLCLALNDALEHAASSGMFKEHYRPPFVSPFVTAESVP